MLHVSFVRSDVARARITRLDVSEARRAKGVHAVFTAADFAPVVKGTLAATMFMEMPIATLRPLADGDVRFAGEAIAMVVADNRYLAEDACELIEVDYEVPRTDRRLRAGGRRHVNWCIPSGAPT
jgi:carbon-monoxide dehydrogenase large subunit